MSGSRKHRWVEPAHLPDAPEDRGGARNGDGLTGCPAAGDLVVQRPRRATVNERQPADVEGLVGRGHRPENLGEHVRDARVDLALENSLDGPGSVQREAWLAGA